VLSRDKGLPITVAYRICRLWWSAFDEFVALTEGYAQLKVSLFGLSGGLYVQARHFPNLRLAYPVTEWLVHLQRAGNTP
jgi:hypothetical protein